MDRDERAELDYIYQQRQRRELAARFIEADLHAGRRFKATNNRYVDDFLAMADRLLERTQ